MHNTINQYFINLLYNINKEIYTVVNDELITPHANVTVENITSKIKDKTVMCVVGTKGRAGNSDFPKSRLSKML